MRLFPSSVVVGVLRTLLLVGQALVSLAAVFLLCLLMKTYLIGPFCRKLRMESKGNKEVLVLGVSAFIFLMLTVTLSSSGSRVAAHCCRSPWSGFAVPFEL